MNDHASKPLGFWSLTAIVVANMIGAGVYTTSGFTLQSLGSRPAVMIAWVVGGIVALLGAISYGLLVREVMASGGEYLYLSRWVHPLAGFLAGWVSYLAGFSAAAAIAAHAFEQYAAALWLPLAPLPPHSLATGLIVLAALLHAANARGGAYGQNVVVAVKLLLIAAFLALAAAGVGSWPGLEPTAGWAPREDWTLAEFGGAVVWISLSYAGFNAAVYVAGETSCPPRRVAAAMVAATLVTTGIYLLLNFVFVYAAPPSRVAGQAEIASIAAKALGGDALASFVGVIICLGLASSVLTLVQVGPRVYAQMAADGLLPRWFSSDRPPPRRAIVFQAASSIAVVWSTSLRDLLGFLGLTLAISSALTVMAYLGLCLQRSRRRQTSRPQDAEDETSTQPASSPEWIRLAAAGGYVLATGTMVGFATAERPAATLVSLAAIIAGVPLYFLLRRTQRHRWQT